MMSKYLLKFNTQLTKKNSPHGKLWFKSKSHNCWFASQSNEPTDMSFGCILLIISVSNIEL